MVLPTQYFHVGHYQHHLNYSFLTSWSPLHITWSSVIYISEADFIQCPHIQLSEDSVQPYAYILETLTCVWYVTLSSWFDIHNSSAVCCISVAVLWWPVVIVLTHLLCSVAVMWWLVFHCTDVYLALLPSIMNRCQCTDVFRSLCHRPVVG